MLIVRKNGVYKTLGKIFKTLFGALNYNSINGKK